MDATERVKHLKNANWGPPLGGSFAQLAKDLKINRKDLVASAVPEDDDTVVIEDATSSG